MVSDNRSPYEWTGSSSSYWNQGQQQPPSIDFAGKQIYSVTVLGTKISVGSYKDARFAVIGELQKNHADFDQLAQRVRGRGPYFSTNSQPVPKGELRKPEPIQNSKLFIETNVGSNHIWNICCRLVYTFGHNPNAPRAFVRDRTDTNPRPEDTKKEPINCRPAAAIITVNHPTKIQRLRLRLATERFRDNR
jgi:hypothetical protein